MTLFRQLAAPLLLALVAAAGFSAGAISRAAAQEGAAQTDAAADAATDAATDAAAPAAAGGADAATSNYDAVKKFVIVAAIFIVPMLLGGWLSNRLKMPDHGWKFAVAIGTLAAAAVTVAPAFYSEESEVIKLGPDLSGGITLIYELQDTTGGQPVVPAGDEAGDGEEGEGPAGDASDTGMSQDQLVEVLIKALTERVDPSGTKEVTIRKYGEGQIEIIIPKAGEQELEYIQRRIYTAGALEFRITASRQFSDHRLIIEQAEQLPPGVNVLTGGDGQELARWVAYDVNEFGPPDVDDGRLVKRQNVDEPQALVLTNDQLNITGEYLRSATPGVDEAMRPQVNFMFNARGAGRFAQLTGSHLPNPSGQRYNLGILLDNKLLSAPSIEGRISDQGRISGGNMSEDEVNFIVGILNAGSLPAALNKDPISREQISPTLGKVTIEKGKQAVVLSVVVVMLFMIAYYRFAGLVACIALFSNLLLTLGAMVLIKGAFTLPGLAGLALTIGMSVDANVLIYERIREELARGAALRMAIRNGFARAMSTIIDSNLTTLLTAIVIYKIAPDNVKGFGVTLILGILMSMFTAIFLSRLVFDVAERLRWIKTLKMSQIIGETHYDFLAKWPIAVGCSLVAIAIGMAAVFFRGSDMLNIDFTGGSSVTLVLKDGDKKPFAEVMKLIQGSELGKENVSLVEVGNSGTRYTVTTINQNVEEVQQILTKTFEGELLTYQVKVQKLEPIGDQRQSARGRGLLAVPLDQRSPVSLLQDDAAEDQVGEAPATAAAAAPAEPSETTAAEEAAADATATSGGESAGAAPVVEAENVDRFAGGTLAQLSFGLSDAANAEIGGGVSYDTLDQLVRDALQASGHSEVAYRLSSPEYRTGTARKIVDWDLRLALDQAQTQEVLTALEQSINGEPIFPLANKIGGRVAGRMTTDALAAILLSLIGIIAYIWFRFHGVVYGLAAVIALVHDVLITLGAVALTSYLVNGAQPLANLLLVEKFQLSLTMVAAFLTIIGYSLNDTIVIFDRIREVKGKSPRLTAEMINTAVNQTLSRTILTAFTTLLTVTVLYVIGGDGIHDFAFALIVGLIAGTYSTVFIATPALLWMSKRAESASKSGGAQAA